LMDKDKLTAQVVNSRVFIANNGQSEKDILTLAEFLRSKGLQVEACLEKKDFVKQMKGAQENGMEYAITEFQQGSDRFKVRQLSTRQDLSMSLTELEEALLKLS